MNGKQLWSVFWLKVGSVNIRTKIMGIVALCVLFSALGMVWYASRDVSAALRNELVKQGITVGIGLASQSRNLILTDDQFALYRLVREQQAVDKNFTYIFVLDGAGNVLAHSFDGGFPADLLEANQVKPGEPYRVQALLTESGRVQDVAVPIVGGKAGVVRLGISEATVKAVVFEHVRKILIWTVLILVLGLFVAYALATILAKPISQLSVAARAIGKGDFKWKAPIWLSETADYFADVVLPAATMEKYEGPLGVKTAYEDAESLRLPPMDPMFDSKGDIDIYLDLCEKAGILYGEGGYLDELNKAQKLELDINTKPTVRGIYEHWAKSAGYDEGVAYFEKHGVKHKGEIGATKRYGYATSPAFGGVIHRLYGESLLRIRDEMKSKGADKVYWQDYTALPTWRQPTMDGSPSDYDLYLISFKQLEFKQSRTPIPLVRELAPQQHCEINTKTATTKGISDGDEVWVESHNAVTGETRKVKTKVRLVEGLRPDTVAMSHHYGMWTHPSTKDGGPTPNTLFHTMEGYVTNTADQTYHVKVRVYK